MAAVSREQTDSRRVELLELLEAGEVNVNDLAERFSVSVSTIRRDLAYLEERGDVQRIYGGAIKRKPIESSWIDKAQVNSAEKRAIASYAATLVHPGDLVMLDAGTTCGQIATELAGRTDITIMTCGLSALVALADAEVDVVVMGGRLRRPNESFIGGRAMEMLADTTPDIAFIGADGLDPIYGLNYPDSEQVVMKRAILNRSRQSWAVVDHSKIEREEVFPYWLDCRTNARLLLDATPSNEVVNRFTRHGWEVVLAGANNDLPNRSQTL